jgi:hypothetical protein
MNTLHAIVHSEQVRDLVPVALCPIIAQLLISGRAITILADHFTAYGDAAIDTLVQKDVIGSLGDITESEEIEFGRLVLNFACFATRKVNALEYLAGKIVSLFSKVVSVEAKGALVKAADVVATYAPGVRAKVKQFVESVQGSPEVANLDPRPIAHVLGLGVE